MATQFRKRQFDDGAFYDDIVFIDDGDSPYAVPDTVETVQADSTNGAVTVNFPAISSANTGRRITVRDEKGTAETYSITVSPDGSDTIDGASSSVMSLNRSCTVYESDGVNEWAVVEAR